MRSQVGTQKEQSQLTSMHKNYMHYLPRGGGGGVESENDDFQKNLLQIQFYPVLYVLWDAQSSRNTKGTVPIDLNS